VAALPFVLEAIAAAGLRAEAAPPPAPPAPRR